MDIFIVLNLNINCTGINLNNARSVMPIVVGNGYGDTSSNPGRD